MALWRSLWFSCWGRRRPLSVAFLAGTEGWETESRPPARLPAPLRGSDKDIPPAHSTSWWVNNKAALTGVGFFPLLFYPLMIKGKALGRVQSSPGEKIQSGQMLRRDGLFQRGRRVERRGCEGGGGGAEGGLCGRRCTSQLAIETCLYRTSPPSHLFQPSCKHTGKIIITIIVIIERLYWFSHEAASKPFWRLHYRSISQQEPVGSNRERGGYGSRRDSGPSQPHLWAFD